MSIYLDTANLKEAKNAESLGWVHGVTTNPLLLAKTTENPYQVVQTLSGLKFKQIFYQLVSTTLESMDEEAKIVLDLGGESMVLKIPPTEIGFQFVTRSGNQFPCCVTAIFSPAQALVAQEAGARYVALYVNRATHLMGNGLQLVQDTAHVLENGKTEILAASIKSAEEACAAISAGAHHLTLPYGVLKSLIANPFSEQAVVDFRENGVGINTDKSKN